MSLFFLILRLFGKMKRDDNDDFYFLLMDIFEIKKKNHLR